MKCCAKCFLKFGKVCKAKQIDKKKFDFRCFVLLFCTGDKYLFFFRHAYIRLTVDDFQADNATLSIHATHTSHAKKRAKNEWEKEIWINKA